MKKPCDRCHGHGSGTYYEYPCYNCIHNPKTPDEILEDHRKAIFEERNDKFEDYKTYVLRTGRNAVSVLIKTKGTAQVWRCGVCHKEFITTTHKSHCAHYCMACGAKIEYEEIDAIEAVKD